MSRLHQKFFANPVPAYCRIRGAEDTEVRVIADYQPPDPDVGIDECVEINDVLDLQGRSLLGIMWGTEVDELEEILLEKYNDFVYASYTARDDARAEIAREYQQEALAERDATRRPGA